jgi:hypothetical protein
MVAMKKPALCESHPNISDERQGTEETIISYWDGKKSREESWWRMRGDRTQGRGE